MPSDTANDIETIADELYGLEPEKFTAARTRYEKVAKAAGDRDAVVAIRGLAKPTVAAWLANQLAREHGDELQPLLELGAGMREATRSLAGDQLRELSKQQHQLVYTLVKQARALARAAGRAVSEDTARGLEETLHAALVDEGAAAQLLEGRLTQPLHNAGFGDVDVSAGTTTPATTPRRKVTSGTGSKSTEKKPVNADDEKRLRAEHALSAAEEVLVEATRARDEAQAQSAQAEHAAEEATEQVEDLQRRLDEAKAIASNAAERQREQTGALRQAEKAVRAAERSRMSAQSRRDGLAPNG